MRGMAVALNEEGLLLLRLLLRRCSGDSAGSAGESRLCAVLFIVCSIDGGLGGCSSFLTARSLLDTGILALSEVLATRRPSTSLAGPARLRCSFVGIVVFRGAGGHGALASHFANAGWNNGLSLCRAANLTSLPRTRRFWGFGARMVTLSGLRSRIGSSIKSLGCTPLPLPNILLTLSQVLGSDIPGTPVSQLATADVVGANALTERILSSGGFACVVDIAVNIGFFLVIKNLGVNRHTAAVYRFPGAIVCVRGDSFVDSEILVLPCFQSSLGVFGKCIQHFRRSFRGQVLSKSSDKLLRIGHVVKALSKNTVGIIVNF